VASRGGGNLEQTIQELASPQLALSARRVRVRIRTKVAVFRARPLSILSRTILQRMDTLHPSERRYSDPSKPPIRLSTLRILPDEFPSPSCEVHCASSASQYPQPFLETTDQLWVGRNTRRPVRGFLLAA
jgi:hypothetical protein